MLLIRIQPEMSITRIKFKIQCSFRTSFLNYSQDNFSKTTKDWHIMHKHCSCSHAKNENLLKSLKPYIFKNDAQMWKLLRKLNFSNIFPFDSYLYLGSSFWLVGASLRKKQNETKQNNIRSKAENNMSPRKFHTAATTKRKTRIK